jgi:glycosyltransferase involved in cell wall biosynthesis
MILVDYESGSERSALVDGVHLTSVGLRQNPIGFYRRLVHLTQGVGPDWVVGFSDIWYGIIADHLARSSNARCAIDAYDNYESYIPWAFPAHALWRRAIARADLVTAAGFPLLRHMTRFGCRGRVAVIPMAADSIFFPRDRTACRLALGLPARGTLIGYAGSLHASRDTKLLQELMRDFESRMPEARFVLCGRQLQALRLPANAMHLGYLPDDQVPLLPNAMDAMLSMNRASKFGDHSYPIKVYESVACGVGCVAARTPATQWMASGVVMGLYTPGNLAELRQSLLDVLNSRSLPHMQSQNWADAGATLAKSLAELSNVAH